MASASAPPPWDQRPDALMKVVEGCLGQDLGKGDAARQSGASRDDGGKEERVEASGHSPTDRLRNGSPVGLSGADEIGECRATSRQAKGFGRLDCLDDSHSDRVTGLRIDQNEAAGLSTVGVAADCDGPVQCDDGSADVIRGQALGGTLFMFFKINDLKPRLQLGLDGRRPKLEEIGTA